MSFDHIDRSILQHLTQGLTAKEIAALVNLSVDAVKDRLEKWRKAYNCQNSTQLACVYVTLSSIKFYEYALK
jgi:DNA-binding NarL/FixJ family response regulator